MSDRFRIDEMVTQDAAGVVFQAFDEDTRQSVWLRRFFPFGPEGGGLAREEITAYEVAVKRLTGVKSPELRAVVGGGVDAVDSMPYIVTERVDGVKLGERIAARGPLTPDEGTRLAEAALAACETLSGVLGEEEVWIETSLESVILADPAQGREYTFWISPLRWLGSDRNGLAPLADLVAEAMGWRGDAATHTGPLGAWVLAVRAKSTTLTLRQAHEELRSVTSLHGHAPQQSTVPIIPRPAPPPPSKASSAAKIFALLIIVISLLGLFVGVPWAIQYQKKRQAEVNRADKLAARGDRVRKPEIASDGDVRSQGQNLRDWDGGRVELTAKIADVVQGDSGKTAYIEFGAGRENDDICAKHDESSGAAYSSWKALVGKRVRIPGVIVIEPSGRVAIEVASPGDVKAVN